MLQIQEFLMIFKHKSFVHFKALCWGFYSMFECSVLLALKLSTFLTSSSSVVLFLEIFYQVCFLARNLSPLLLAKNLTDLIVLQVMPMKAGGQDRTRVLFHDLCTYILWVKGVLSLYHVRVLAMSTTIVEIPNRFPGCLTCLSTW